MKNEPEELAPAVSFGTPRKIKLKTLHEEKSPVDGEIFVISKHCKCNQCGKRYKLDSKAYTIVAGDEDCPGDQYAIND
jgi:hypothetical protein